MKVENDVKKLRNHDRSAAAVAQNLGVAVEKSLIHTVEIAAAEFGADELEEAPGAVEDLTHAGRRQARSETGNLDIQTCVEILPQPPRHRRIRDRVEMHGNMASTGILAKDGWPEIPARVAVPRKVMAIETGPQRRRRQHRDFIPDRRRQTRGGSRPHCHASGGK